MKFHLPEASTIRPLRAMHSLREKHVKVLAVALSQLPETWSMERHEGYDGDLTLMLMSQHQERENLVVSHRADGFHLMANQEDDCWKLGCFDALDELVAIVQKNAAVVMRKARWGYPGDPACAG